MPSLRLIAAVAAMLATGCSSRPPWADGRMVQERRDPAAPPPSFGNLPARLLAIHNRERTAAGVPLLQWDPALAAAAAVYARELAALGRLEHSPRQTRPGQGENLWMGTHNAYTLKAMANAWAGEKRIFRAGTFPDVSRSGNWSDVAHYTQMIWRGTTRVGCAIGQGRAWDVLVCRYAPAGNVMGQRVP